jgi:UDP-N-acetylmuramoyl-tripeptide--D-alanyl-D-alanine ligase
MFREFMLGEIVEMVNGEARFFGTELVRRVSINSRQTKPGDLFFALKGQHADGHDYVEDAFRHGALAAVVERKQSFINEILVSDALFALGELARNYRQHFTVKTIGITGTTGKTTVKNLVAAILRKQYRVLCTEKNYNSLIGLPLTILGLSGDEDYSVLEMGTNAAGEIRRLCDVARPDIGLITNIGPGHLAGLKSIEGIRREKFALLDALPRGGLALVGEGAGESTRDNFGRFSRDMIETVEITEHGSSFSYHGSSFFTQLLGMANVYNCLAAVCLTSLMGIDYHAQRVAIAESRPLPGRMEPISVGGLLIINDTYNANPTSMKAAIDFVTALNRRKILVLGDMLELGLRSRELHQDVGHYARRRADILITLGQESELYRGKHFVHKNELLCYLNETLVGDEVVLFKASRALRFEELVNRILMMRR